MLNFPEQARGLNGDSIGVHLRGELCVPFLGQGGNLSSPRRIGDGRWSGDFCLERGLQRLQGQLGIGDEPHLHRIVTAYLLGVNIDLDELRARREHGIPTRRPAIQPAPHHEHDIGLRDDLIGDPAATPCHRVPQHT